MRNKTFYSEELSISEAKTPTGKEYELLNLPYCLGTQLEKYLEWFTKLINL